MDTRNSKEFSNIALDDPMRIYIALGILKASDSNNLTIRGRYLQSGVEVDLPIYHLNDRAPSVNILRKIYGLI